jgi:hypothetical protein
MLFMMLTKLRTLASLYRELGLRWSAFRLAYAFRLRSGLIRLQMPQYEWGDRPLETWLQPNIPSDLIAYTKWRKQNQPKFFFDEQLPGRVAEDVSRPSRLPANVPWDPKTSITEADRILNGETKYFSHEFHRTGFPPKWHQIPSMLPPPSAAAYVSPNPAAEDGVGSMEGI